MQNDIRISFNETSVPSIVVNGVDITACIKPEFRLVSVENEDGFRSAELTVTFPVAMP